MGILDNLKKLILPSDNSVNPRHGVDSLLTDFIKFKGEFRGTPQERAEAAEAHITITRCINFVINHIISMDWQIMSLKKGSTDENVITSHCKDNTPHAFKNMLGWHYTQYNQNFFDRWLRMNLVHGSTYMEKLFRGVGESKMPGGLRILNSMCVEPEIRDGQLLWFNYHDLNDPIATEVPVDNILWSKLPSMLSDFRGKSPMDRALEAVNLDRFNIFTVRSWLINDNKPSIVFTLDPNAPNYSKEELDRFVEQWKEQGQGPTSGYSTRLLPAAFHAHEVGTQRPDMQISMHMSVLICREFGIDPILIGVIDETDGSTINEKTAAFESKFIAALTDTVKPCLYYIEEFINYNIMPFLCGEDSGQRFCWCYGDIDRMIKYSQTAVDQMRSDLLSGVITKNEYRKSRFYEPLKEGGDVFVIPKGYVHVGRDEMETLQLLKEIDPKVLKEFINEQKAIPAAFMASASPDFAEDAVSSDVQGENRYPVIDNE